LDLGCGRLMPVSRILRNYGKTVLALDAEYVYELPSVINWANSLRYNGLQSSGRNFLLDIQKHRSKTQDAIDDITGNRIRTKIRILRNGVENMCDVPTSSVDLAISISLLEHVRDVEAAFAEIRRVLRPGGLAANAIHLWGSVSGDHNPEWREFKRYPPWCHLRGRTNFRLPYAILNKFTSVQYIAALRKHFSEVKYEWIEDDELLKFGEARDLLTEEVLGEIRLKNPAMPREDLLYATFILCARAEDASQITGSRCRET